jgi:hypothetical protein
LSEIERHPDISQASDQAAIELCGYRLQPSVPTVVPASVRREWMDQTSDRFATRCLPMMLANQAGWFVLNPIAVRVTWNGGAGPRDLMVEYARTPPPQHPVVSYFGHGVVTWRIPILFRTPRGFQLLVRGPANSPKRDVYALEGIVETSWSIATFTMNWKLLTPSVPFIFEENEPICVLVPYRVGDIERVKPVMTSIFADPSLAEAYKAWSGQRFEFIRTRDEGAWEKDYVRGGRAHSRQGRSAIRPDDGVHDTRLCPTHRRFQCTLE